MPEAPCHAMAKTASGAVGEASAMTDTATHAMAEAVGEAAMPGSVI
jgi:hypothetical protein